MTECDDLITQYGTIIKRYDANGDGHISKTEAIQATIDFNNGLITKPEAVAISLYYFNDCSYKDSSGTSWIMWIIIIVVVIAIGYYLLS